MCMGFEKLYWWGYSYHDYSYSSKNLNPGKISQNISLISQCYNTENLGVQY